MDDLIYRQEAIKEINRFLGYLDEDMLYRLSTALKRLPSAQQWIPVTERLPGEFVSVQAHMTDAEPFPSVREAYLAGGEWFFPALNEYHPVDKWAEFLESPEEKSYVQERAR